MVLHLSVSYSVHRRGVSAPLNAGIHKTPRQTPPPGRLPRQTPRADPSGQTHSWADPLDTTGYGQQAGGTHLTGMHSCESYERKCLVRWSI